MADKKQTKFSFKPIILDQDNYSKRRVIRQLPTVHQSETLQKFFSASVDHLFDAGKAKPINGYVGQRPLWLDADQDFYLNEPTTERQFYQLEPSMVSRGTDTAITNLLFYPDMINQIRYQGGNVENHSRLFDQEFYSWCPPIDLDKNINFRQYFWLEAGPPEIKIWGPKTDVLIGDGIKTEYDLPAGEGTLYDYENINPITNIRVLVDGRNYIYTELAGVTDTFTYDATTHKVTITPVPPVDAEVQIWIYSDVANNVVGKDLADDAVKAQVIKALGGVIPSAGMKIRMMNDINPAYNGKAFVFENTGGEVVLLNDDGAVDPDSLVDDREYITIARGCRDGNQWSTRNRWFHRDVADNDFMEDTVRLSVEELLAAQASRPIVEFIRDLELFNYGRFRRPDVHIRLDGQANSPVINNLVTYVQAHPNQLDFDGLHLKNGYGNTIEISGVLYENVRLLVDNTAEPLINNRIYSVISQAGLPLTANTYSDWRIVPEADLTNGFAGYYDATYIQANDSGVLVLKTNAAQNPHFATAKVVKPKADKVYRSTIVLRKTQLASIGQTSIVRATIDGLQSNGTAVTDLGKVFLNGQEVVSGLIDTANWSPNDWMEIRVEWTADQPFDAIRAHIQLNQPLDPASDNFSDAIYEIRSQDFADVTVDGTPKLSLALESDGQDPSGSPVNGEVVKVLLGSKANITMFYDGVEWIDGQQKGATGPLFNLYDMNGVSLSDPGIYPKSSFAGSRLFSYQIDEVGSRPVDPQLGFRPVYDNKGQFKFQNYTATERFTYVENNDTVAITGLYFNKAAAANPDDDQLSNDWFKANYLSRQMIVDQYIADGTKKIFDISQEPGMQDLDTPPNIVITIGRVDSNKDFQKIILREGPDYVRKDRQVLIYDVRADDVIDIRTFNPEVPTNRLGFYEVPLNLRANPLTEEVGIVAKGDFFEHFAEIIRSQEGFQGAEYAANNWRDTAQARNLGQQIIQNSASLLKAMMLSSEDQLDFMNASRFAEAEYARFRAKFEQKITDFWLPAAPGQVQLSLNDSVDTWINTALREINRGKTKEFPFYNSGVGITTDQTTPTFIPATPSFLGVYPLYAPQIIEDTTNESGNRYILGHDGSMTLCYQNGDDQLDPRDQVILGLEIRIYNSVPDNIRTRERPFFDHEAFHGDKFRTADYSYAEYQTILRPAFERWNAKNGLDYHANDLSPTYETYAALRAKQAENGVLNAADQQALDDATAALNNPWDWNWSSVRDRDGQPLPGNWRGIYQLYFGTDRPHTAPWEMLGFTSEPVWWFARYGGGPYTSDNHIMWDEIEKGFIAEGQRQGFHKEFARPGMTGRYDAAGELLASPVPGFIPVDRVGELLHPGPREIQPDGSNTGGCGIATDLPLLEYAVNDWQWGDGSPVESVWMRSNHYPFAVAQASYLMKPARFIEYGWDSANLITLFPGTDREQLINRETMTRAVNANLQVHGEVNEDYSIVQRFGVQQWVSDLLASRNLNITTNFGDKVRGLSAQLAYKVAGFTESSNLFVVSDSFDRVPSEDVSTSLYKSPSIREEFYGGVIVEKDIEGWRVYGFDVLDPSFKIIKGDPNSAQLSVGGGLTSAPVPDWKPGVNYTVNLVVRYSDHYYRCIRTHTSASLFEAEFWIEVDRPQYADGTALLWNLDTQTTGPVVKIPYGSLLKSPQDVADFINGYQRFLVGRGFVFDRLDTTELEVQDWRSSLLTFITWSQEDLDNGAFIALSPSNGQIKYVTDSGTIQPVERIVNGVYAIVDRSGNPIQPTDTSVMRTDGEILVTPTDTVVGGIYGLRLYVCDVEHVIVMNNTTIFNDIIYSPLLNIRQPRLRLQGFKTRNWKGRIDAPGFVVTGNTLIPNFEKTADDFRQYFAIESVESTKLQALARANIGYEEREYLDNLLLTPTNQLELYQGMIQQKGTPAVMKRLLRSNFIRHNQGMKFFEEWAFRVGDYGGSEIKPTMVIKLNQSDIKNNPQLIEFNSVEALPPVGDTETTIVSVNDIFDANGVLLDGDDRWVWRPDQQYVNWPAFKEQAYEKGSLPRAGYVNVNEVSFFLKNESDFTSLLDITFDAAAAQDKRIWNYGFDSSDWATYRFAKATQNIVSLTPPSVDGQATIIALDAPLVQNTVLPKRNRDTNYVNGDLTVVNNRIILRDFTQAVETPLGEIYRPAVHNSLSVTLTPTSDEITPFMDAVSLAGLLIEGLDIEVIEPFAEGSTLIIGTEDEGLEDLFVRLPFDETSVEPDYTTRASKPVETYIVQKPYEISQVSPTATVDVVRVGQFEVDPCDPTLVHVTWIVKDADGNVIVGYDGSTDLSFDPAHQVEDDSSMRQSVSIPVPTTQDSFSIQMTSTIVDSLGQPITPLDQYQHISDSATVTVVRPSAGGAVYVDLTKKGVVHTNLEMPSAYPYDMLAQRIDDLIDIMGYDLATATEIAEQPTHLVAGLSAAGSTTGQVKITVRYRYTKGFELYSNDEVPVPVLADKANTGGKIYGLVPTRFKDFAETQDMPGLNQGIVEIDNYDVKGWATYDFSVPGVVRHQNSRVQSKQITSAAIYNANTNELKQVLQLFDPVKGYIPGVADRELSYKLDYDPADYNRSSDDSISLDEDTAWGPEQVGQLWWDLSTTRYLDYEINDTVSGGVDYRWKHWGRLAPTIEIDIYEWVRSTSHPVDWAELVKVNADVSVLADSNKPTGTVKAATQPMWVERLEWNDELQRDDTVYYFWVKDVATVPPVGGRNLTAVQVSSIIQDPVANDIPYVAIIDTNKIVVGSTNQFLDDTDTVLKVTWNITNSDNDAYETIHHKQWSILRENDERNTINIRMWNKMRDSLVGWDTYQDTNSALTTLAVGFDVDDIGAPNFSVKVADASLFLPNGRAIISTTYNDDVWITYSWVDRVANALHGVTIDNVITFQPIPAGVQVSQERAVDAFKSVPDAHLSDDEALGNMIRPRQSWFPAEWVDMSTMTKRPSRTARQLFVDTFNTILSAQPYVDQWYNWQRVFETGTPVPDSSEYTFEVQDFNELEALPTLPNPIKPGQLAFIPNTTEARGFWTLWRWTGTEFLLERSQDYRLQEGELWEYADWYDSNWGPGDFPIYRFKTMAERDAAAPLDVTLTKGTLVRVEQQSETDPRWSWHVYTSTGWIDVAKQNGTIRLKSNFYDAQNQLFMPAKGTTLAQARTSFNSAVLLRDGTWEIKWLLDTLNGNLFTKLQINNLFFSMVKAALSLNQDTDWVFKTSFLYLGGYSEELKQSPVAQADQINNVIAYLEDVKPYHVKIRDYVRRLSYGPDVGRVVVTDFDKPVYAEGSGNAKTTRVLNPLIPDDLTIIKANHPWVDWWANEALPAANRPIHRIVEGGELLNQDGTPKIDPGTGLPIPRHIAAVKTNYDLDNWDTDWYPVRHFKTKIQLDRIACSSTNGWDYVEVPWDSAQIRYRHGEVYDVMLILNTYRDLPDSDFLAGLPNPYKDVTVSNIKERNLLVRDRKVVRGTIATVNDVEPTFWIWTTTNWLQIWATQWDGNWFNGAVDRIKEAYQPLPGMKQIDSDGLISGCGIKGTKQDGDYFEHGMYDEFAWDYQGQGWADEFEYYAGRDVELNPDAGFDQTDDTAGYDDDGASINIDGSGLVDFAAGDGHPEELARIRAKDPLTITVYDSATTTAFRVHQNGLGHWENVRLDEQNVTVTNWDPATRELVINTSASAFPFHDPANPSKEFLDTVRVAQGYRATKSANTFGLGAKQFKLSDWNANKRLKTLPTDLMPRAGKTVEVIIEEPGNSKVRMVGEVQFSGNLQDWLDSKTLDIVVTGYIGDSSALPAGSINEWNIIPKRIYNQLGVIWIGHERMTYQTVTGSGTSYTLGGVRRGTATTFAQDTLVGQNVYDGSVLKWMPNDNVDLRKIPGPPNWQANYKAWKAFLAKSDGGPTH